MTRNDDIWNDENQFFKKIMAVKEKITKEEWKGEDEDFWLQYFSSHAL